MKKSLSKKCYPFIIMMIFSFATANAQIVYTDVNPDDTVSCATSNCSDSIYVDLNNDGSMDFILTFNRITLGTCNIMGRPRPRYATNRVVSTIGANPFYGIVSSNPSALNYGDIIDSNLIWRNGADTLINNTMNTCNSSTTAGNWNSTANQYLPVKFSITGDNYYGWIRMQRASSTTSSAIILKDYAYNSIPNQPIFAGQTNTTGITEDFSASSIALYPNPATNHFTIDLGSNNKNVAVTITDITGKLIPIANEIGENKIEVNTTEFAEGIYIVQIQSAGIIRTKKLVIEK